MGLITVIATCGLLFTYQYPFGLAGYLLVNGAVGAGFGWLRPERSWRWGLDLAFAWFVLAAFGLITAEPLWAAVSAPATVMMFAGAFGDSWARRSRRTG